MPDLPVRALTIYLINADVEFDDIIEKKKVDKYQFFDLGQYRYHIYSLPKRFHLPKWSSFFENRLLKDMIWESSAPGVTLLIEVDGRNFAIAFGQGRSLLNADCLEDRFGLKVVLNTVEKVRSMDKKSFDAILGQTRTQASSYTDVGQFGFDIEKDLLQAVTGLPTDVTFGERLTGADALAASVRVDLAGLPQLLGRYLKQSAKTDYREKGFKFVDHMRPIQAPASKEKLEKALIQLFLDEIGRLKTNRGSSDFDIDLVIPQVVDWEMISLFRYDRNPKTCEEMYDISIATFLAYLAAKTRTALDINKLRRTEIIGMDGDERELKYWSSYKCLVGELTIDDKKYVLSDGNWYEVNENYVEQLDAYIKGIDPYPVLLPLYQGGKEKEYNKGVETSIPGFYCFDRTMVHPMKGQPMEFCDLYTESYGYRDLIHVKRGKSSAVLSHLFNQGTTSAEVYRQIKDCRDQAEEMVESALGSATYSSPGRPETFRIVYGIIRPKAGKLPFFSKVNLKQAHQQMALYSMDCLLSEIEYHTDHLGTKR
jgi:uncharacterized protein (TIGR04141 family)